MDKPPAKLSQDITFEWSPGLIATCTRRYILRKSRRTQALVLLLLALGIFCLIKGMAGGWILIGLCLWIPSLFLRNYLRTIKVAKETSDRKVTVRIDPETIFVHTSQEDSTLKWSQINAVWSSADVLMLFPHGRSQYIALPVAPLGNDLRQYIETAVRQSGGKVT